MRITDGIEVRSNLELTMRERGKLREKRVGHNIWVNLGREWLPMLMSYSALPAPPGAGTPMEDRRVRYMGLGIGGTRQLQKATVADVPPMSTYYGLGTNTQTDTDPTVTTLERPVRVSSPIPAAPTIPPWDAGDVWLAQIQAPPTFPVATSVTYSRVFLEDEVSYGPFLSVPLSEIGLFLSSPSANYIHQPHNTFVAYDTFDTISKTTAFSLEVAWTIRF